MPQSIQLSLRRALLAAAGFAALVLAFATVVPATAQTVARPSPPDASGPQTMVPAPLGNGVKSDVPGGSARNGVIVPPATGTSSAVITPPAQGNMPVIAPPGTTGGQPSLVPK